MMDALNWLLNTLFWALLVLPGWLIILSPVILLFLLLFWGIRKVVRSLRRKEPPGEE